MEDIIGDLTNIYLACIDSYTPRWRQTIDDKYKVMDKCLLAVYLYVLIIENREINNASSTQTLVNYLTRQAIYSEVGNLQYETKDTEKMHIFNETMEKVVMDRFQYLNNRLKTLKFPYKTIVENDYTKLIQFLEDISDYSIMKKIIHRGNKEAVNIYSDKCKHIKNLLNTISRNDMFYKEKMEIIELIENEKFEDSIYGRLVSVLLNLKDVHRFSITSLLVDENVLFHQFMVAITSLCIAIYANNNLNENFDIYKTIVISLFHDFGEYTGAEITSHIKKYNETTKKMFGEIEEAFEKQLRNKLGNKIYNYIKAMNENEPESYVCELMDKIHPFIKLYLEAYYYSNYTLVRQATFVYSKKLQIFSRIDDIDGISNKSFFKNLLIQHYIYLKEGILDANATIRSKYFTEDEIKKVRDEIKMLRENPESFWN